MESWKPEDEHNNIDSSALSLLEYLSRRGGGEQHTAI
jgi:hypothetical protein